MTVTKVSLGGYRRRLMLMDEEETSVREWTKIVDYQIQDGDKVICDLKNLPGYTELYINSTHLYNQHETMASKLQVLVNGCIIFYIPCDKKPVVEDENSRFLWVSLTYNGLYWNAESTNAMCANRAAYIGTPTMLYSTYAQAMELGACTSLSIRNPQWPMECGHIEVWAR